MTEITFRWSVSALPRLDNAPGMREASLSWGQDYLERLAKERFSGRPALNARTGNLARDWTLNVDAITVSVESHGAADAYAGLQESGTDGLPGGALRPVNAKWLWIPLEANLTPQGVARMTPSQAIATGNVFIQWHKGPIAFMCSKTAGGWQLTPLFVLKKSISFPVVSELETCSSPCSPTSAIVGST